ncbi:Cyclic nucleotide-gated cation channel subunit A [Gryllus bimaculatus]|nr:Cyclic nucleotide-gated cation channel subunit A [Gryllus bimaculatus]
MHGGSQEAEILNVLSAQLRQEILLHTCRRLVENVSFFNNLPAGLLLRIVLCMRAEMFLANDVVVKAGARGECMYFITSGTVAIYTTTGREASARIFFAFFPSFFYFYFPSSIVDQEVGYFFPDQHQRRVASVVAIECCELYRLDQRDFVRAINPFPDLVTRIERVAEERYERTMQMDAGDKRRRAISRLSEAHHALRRSMLLARTRRDSNARKSSLVWRRGVQRGSSIIS